MRNPIGVHASTNTGPWRRVIKRDPCAYCGKRPSNTLDHIEPRGSGGSNDISNLVGACFDCNNAKGNLSVLGYLLVRHFGYEL